MGAPGFPRRDLVPLDARAFRWLVIIVAPYENTAARSLHA